MKGLYEHTLASSIMIKKKIKHDISVCEEALTSTFLEKMSEHRKINYFQFNNNQEAVSGADWLWIIISNNDLAYKFHIQAKRLRSNKSMKDVVLYNKGVQLDNLIENAKKYSAIPGYVFYSSDAALSRCDLIEDSANMGEGVLLGSAQYIRRFIDRLNDVPVTTPISCLFAQFGSACHYALNGVERKRCKCCSLCHGRTSCCLYCSRQFICPDEKNNCRLAFETYWGSLWGVAVKPTAPTDDILVLSYAPSLVHCREPLACKYYEQVTGLPSQFEQEFSEYQHVKNIAVCKTFSSVGSELAVGSKHDKENNGAVLRSARKDEKEYLLCRLFEIYSDYKHLVESIGLFGSFAKDRQRPNSDIDIIIRYSKDNSGDSVFSDAASMIRELKSISRRHVDIVDEGYCEDGFYKSIFKDIIYVNSSRKGKHNR